MRLGRSDLEAVLGFLDEVDRLDGHEGYTPDIVSLLGGLVPCEVVSFQDADLAARRFIEAVPAQPTDDDVLYWTYGPCPIGEYRTRTGDLTAIRMSDVVGRSRYHELPVYREYFRPGGLEHVLDLGLSIMGRRYQSIVFLRGRDEGEFSERDRAVLEAVRPHLRAREARTELRRRLLDGESDGDEREVQPPLTAREREIVRLVSEGGTNTEIAAELWVSPSTVKKHLEHVYEKLGVTGRAAAAAAVQAHGISAPR